MVENIIGRKQEIRKLSGYLTSNKAEFVLVYGRRRVGKTFLIKEFFNNEFAFYFSGAEKATTSQQLFNFTNALNKYTGADNPVVENWQQAFVQLENYLTSTTIKGKKVIFIDELPWLDNAKSGFLSAFEYFWNTFASSQTDILLIVCGSATSWLIKKVLHDRGGLHNRVTQQICLEPFSLKETEQFFQSKNVRYSRLQITETYMSLGGIPYYLDLLDRNLSLYKNIDNLFFSRNGVLRTEYKKLYSSLFKSPEKYMRVIEVLAQKRKGVLRDEISKQTGISNGGGLTTILEELENCGFIAVNNNFTNIKRNQLYQLIDFYSLFYLNFVKQKSITDSNYWTTTTNTPARNAWLGFSFELLCISHISQIKKALGISGVVAYTSSWKSIDSADGAQIDLVFNRNDNVINLCEMKFSKDEYTITKDYDRELRHKEQVFLNETATKKSVNTTMITTFGVTHNEYWGNIQSEVTLEDLFQ